MCQIRIFLGGGSGDLGAMGVPFDSSRFFCCCPPANRVGGQLGKEETMLIS